MERDHNQAGERLWRHIVDLKYAEVEPQGASAVAQSAGEQDMAGLSSLAEELQEAYASTLPQGAIAARARLLEEIQRTPERTEKAAWPGAPGAGARRPLTLALVALLVFLLGTAIALVLVRVFPSGSGGSCGQSGSSATTPAPVAEGLPGPRGPDDCPPLFSPEARKRLRATATLPKHSAPTATATQ